MAEDLAQPIQPVDALCPTIRCSPADWLLEPRGLSACFWFFASFCQRCGERRDCRGHTQDPSDALTALGLLPLPSPRSLPALQVSDGDVEASGPQGASERQAHPGEHDAAPAVGS